MGIFNGNVSSEKVRERLAELDERDQKLEARRDHLKEQLSEHVARGAGDSQQAQELRKQLGSVTAELESMPSARAMVQQDLESALEREAEKDFRDAETQYSEWLKTNEAAGARVAAALSELAAAIEAAKEAAKTDGLPLHRAPSCVTGWSSESDNLDSIRRLEHVTGPLGRAIVHGQLADGTAAPVKVSLDQIRAAAEAAGRHGSTLERTTRPMVQAARERRLELARKSA